MCTSSHRCANDTSYRAPGTGADADPMPKLNPGATR